MIHNTAAKRRSKTHLTFVGCVLLCARDGILEKSRNMQSMNTPNFMIMQPGLSRPDDT